MPGVRPRDRSEPVRDRERVEQLRARAVRAERLQVRVAHPLQARRARLEVEPPRRRAQRHGERVEGVRDAAVAPVEHEVLAVPDEDVAVVQVVVLDRLRDPHRRELGAEALDLRHGREQALVLAGVETVLTVDEQDVAVCEHALEARRQRLQPLVRHAEPEQALRLVRGGELHVRVERRGTPPSGRDRRRSEAARATAYPASAVTIQPRCGSTASTSITRSGRRRASSIVSAGSKPWLGWQALNQTSPAAVGTRSTVDHQYTCGCSISPVTSTCSWIHVFASASHSGRVQSRSACAVTIRRRYWCRCRSRR